MFLKPYKIKIKTGGVMVAVLHEDTANKLDLHVGDRIRLQADRTQVTCLLDITKNSFPKQRVGLFAETYEAMNIDHGDTIKITPVEKPNSVLHIRKKLDGKRLNEKQLNEIIADIVRGNLSEVEMTYFVSGCYANGLDDTETAALTRSIVNNGKRLSFGKRIVADKHCIGGVPGNRVTPIVVAIVAAAGILMPKTSSRAITSPAGTADAIETICNVTINAHRLQTIAKQIGGFMVWGGGVDLAAADDRMIKIRNPMSLDPEGMLLASIMAKKHSVGASHVLIDIPVGPDVKIKDASHAKHLQKRFVTIGNMLGMKVRVIVTDGSQPIGRGIGPYLEMLDIIHILKNDPTGPQDLREKAIMEACIILEMTGTCKKGNGEPTARQLLTSGKAWQKFNQIVEAQGRKRPPKPARHSADVCATKNGIVRAINNKTIAHLARLAGAPKDSAAGLFIRAKKGDYVKKGQPLFTIYANSKERLAYTMEFAKENGYIIKNEKVKK